MNLIGIHSIPLMVVLFLNGYSANAFTISCESQGSTPEGKREFRIQATPQGVDVLVVGYRSFPALDAAIRKVDPSFSDSVGRIELRFSDGKDCRQALSEGRIGVCMSPFYSANMDFIGVNGTTLNATGTAGVEVTRTVESHVGDNGGINNVTTFSGKGVLTFKSKNVWETAAFELSFAELLCTES